MALAKYVSIGQIFDSCFILSHPNANRFLVTQSSYVQQNSLESELFAKTTHFFSAYLGSFSYYSCYFYYYDFIYYAVLKGWQQLTTPLYIYREREFITTQIKLIELFKKRNFFVCWNSLLFLVTRQVNIIILKFYK